LQGNEDVGQMSAWYVLSSLGFYPVDAVSGNYVLGSPLFDHAVVDLGNGRQLKIDVQRSDPGHVYVQRFWLNGRQQQRAWFHHSEIANGASIRLEMGADPALHFAVAPETAPPSAT
jgi:putative alpha-1,2-mannosidase